jgi:hypothetical protein
LRRRSASQDNWKARLEYRCWGCGASLRIGDWERAPRGWCSDRCKRYVHDLSEQCRESRFAPTEMRKLILERDHYRCAYCKMVVTDVTANIEHVKPWHAGGRTVHSNLVASCRDCNRAKYGTVGIQKAVEGRGRAGVTLTQHGRETLGWETARDFVPHKAGEA